MVPRKDFMKKKNTILPPDVELPVPLKRDSEMDKISKGYQYKVVVNTPQVDIAWFKTYKEAIEYYKEKLDRILN